MYSVSNRDTYNKMNSIKNQISSAQKWAYQITIKEKILSILFVLQWKNFVLKVWKDYIHLKNDYW